MFSRSKSVITIGDHVMDHSSVVTTVSSFLSPTRIYLTPSTSGDSLKLGRNVGRALAALPDTYEKNKGENRLKIIISCSQSETKLNDYLK